MPGLPLILVVGESTEQIFAEWRERALLAGGGFGVLIVLAWILGIASGRQAFLRLRDHRLYKLFTEQSFDLILWLDLDGVRHYVSPSSTSIWGEIRKLCPAAGIWNWSIPPISPVSSARGNRFRAGNGSLHHQADHGTGACSGWKSVCASPKLPGSTG